MVLPCNLSCGFYLDTFKALGVKEHPLTLRQPRLPPTSLTRLRYGGKYYKFYHKKAQIPYLGSHGRNCCNQQQKSYTAPHLVCRWYDATKAAFQRTVSASGSAESGLFTAEDSRCLMMSDGEAAQLLGVGSPDQRRVGLTRTRADSLYHPDAQNHSSDTKHSRKKESYFTHIMNTNYILFHFVKRLL